MDYFNARNLQARTGRMNAPDPLFGDAVTNPQRWNRYSYVGNNPLRMTDPTGMEGEAADYSSIWCRDWDDFSSDEFSQTWGQSAFHPLAGQGRDDREKQPMRRDRSQPLGLARLAAELIDARDRQHTRQNVEDLVSSVRDNAASFAGWCRNPSMTVVVVPVDPPPAPCFVSAPAKAGPKDLTYET